MLADNVGYGELGCYGGGPLRGAPTPRLDALAAQGMRLTNMNMESQCTPSRSALMTGRFAIRSGTTQVITPTAAAGLVQWEVTLAELLAAKGYATGHFGKWHLGNREGRFPSDQGFDEWWGIIDSHTSVMWASTPGFDPTTLPRPHLLEGKRGQPSKRLGFYDMEQRRLFDEEAVRRTITFMRNNVAADRPFFAYVPLGFAHFPVLPHPEFSGRTGNGDFADALVEFDYRVGQLLGAVTELDIECDTVFILTSDNGAEETVPWRGWTGPWGGSYFTAMEGCLRVPLIARWPGYIEAGSVSNEIVHAVDLFATVAQIAGAEIPGDRAIDGVNQLDFFLGKQAHSNREGFPIYVADTLHAVKWRHWKMHFVWQEYMYDSPLALPLPRVFNLFEDPRERNDIYLPAHSWVRIPVQRMLDKMNASLRAEPPVPTGAADPYLPPRAPQD